MPSKQNIFSPGIRKRKAYWTAFIVFSSYFWLILKSKIFGRAYFEKRIKALHQKNANRIKNRIQELEGLFIKIGQLISNLSNVLPPEFRDPLGELQDNIQPKPFSEITETIKLQLGKSPNELFTSFDENALAAASIGQVHRATIGEKAVVVKIQHANIEKIAKADLAILKNLVKLHAYFMDMKGMDHMYDQVSQMIQEELDYTKEAQSMKQIAENLKEVPELRVIIPDICMEFCTPKILVAAYHKGAKISNVQQIREWGVDQEDVVKRLIELYCKMVLVDGFYHADPHPGNILVNKEGEIILLDFGAVATINPTMKSALPELIEAIIRNDTEDTVSALKKMGFIGSDEASRAFVEKLITLFREFIEDEVEFDGMNFQNIKLNSGISSIASFISKIDLREVSNTIRIPKDYILLNRTVVLLMGNAFQLAPDLNTMDIVRPYMQKHILSKDGGITQLIIKTLKNQLTSAISIPSELSRFLKSANRGELKMEIKGLDLGLARLYYLGQQFLFGALALLFGYFLFNFGETAGLLRTLNWIGVVGFSGLFLLALLRAAKSK